MVTLKKFGTIFWGNYIIKKKLPMSLLDTFYWLCMQYSSCEYRQPVQPRKGQSQPQLSGASPNQSRKSGQTQVTRQSHNQSRNSGQTQVSRQSPDQSRKSGLTQVPRQPPNIYGQTQVTRQSPNQSRKYGQTQVTQQSLNQIRKSRRKLGNEPSQVTYTTLVPRLSQNNRFF